MLAFDMTGAQLGHVFRLGLFTVKHGLHYIQEGFPIRMKQIHFFNLVSFIDKILAVVRPFMKQSLWDILYLDPKIEDTYECIPPDVFPTDYSGGTALSVRELHGELGLLSILIESIHSENFLFFRHKLQESVQVPDLLLRSRTK